ncbi:hypothetical protein [Enhygromyxa salina]|uniref:Uncharacterized protein n=1 Tax=Enhygromyxa salina TaxID=215803 RepID=A0A2S9YAB4_9BACT|nr:hypothetical protein [Enhygromyxa salina]PRQ02054.1 hypothetical protein ENSA7_56270 [Enhygromyxa salina]
MSTMKVIGIVAASLTVAGLVGGGVWWWQQRKKKPDGARPISPDARPGPTPSGPPRPAPSPEPTDTNPKGHFLSPPELPAELEKVLNEQFPDSWPPEDAVVNAMTQEDQVVVAVESEPVGNYTQTRQELISAKVLSVEKTLVRGRVIGPVVYAEHHGAHAGHGFRVGDLVEVPRSKILLAARSVEPKKKGYGGEGKPEQTFKPSNLTGETYQVRPATPYDLSLPYRTNELEWYVDREMVKMIRIGASGLLEQIMFSEDSMRGLVTVRALDNDPKEGKIFVARWEFNIDP